MFRAFEIPFEYALDLIESALYLDLPNLVELGCRVLVSQFSKLKSLSGLPEPIVRTILKMLNIGELIVAEHQLLLHETSIDTTSAWIDKFWKVLSHYAQTNKPVPEYLQSDKLLPLAKKVCIEFYTSQIIQKVSKEVLGKRNLLSKVLGWSGHFLTQLLVHIDSGSLVLDASFWDEVFGNTPNVKELQIHCNQINPSLSLLLASAAKLLHISQIDLILVVQQMNSAVWGEISPFFVVPMVNNSKIGTALDKSRFVRLKTEKNLNIQGSSSLAEYLDRPEPKKQEILERIPQKTSPIQLQVIEDTRSPVRAYPFKILETNSYIPYLSALNLENASLGMEGAIQLAAICSNDTACISLQEINLSNTKLGSDGLTQVINAIVANKRLCGILKCLRLSNLITETQLYESDVMKTLSVALPSFAKLHSLDVSRNYFSTVSLRLFFDNLVKSKIQNLNVSEIPVSTSIHSVVQWTKTRQSVQMRLSNCSLLPRTLMTMLKDLSKDIVVFDISYNSLDCQVARALKLWMQHSSLRELNLSGIPNLPVEVLVRDAKRLEKLSLDNCSLDDDSIPPIVDTIMHGSIAFCSLKNNYITGVGFGMLQSGRRSCRNVVRLDLEGNRIEEVTIKRYQKRTMKHGAEGLLAIFGNQKVAT
jgi:hypothetical protein